PCWVFSSSSRVRSSLSFCISVNTRRTTHRWSSTRNGRSSRDREPDDDKLARTPAACVGPRSADRQPDRLDTRLHVRPVHRVERVLPLRPLLVPRVAPSEGGLRRRQVARVELSRRRRARRRNGPAVRVLDSALGGARRSRAV